jgi:hypothetical protein
LTATLCGGKLMAAFKHNDVAIAVAIPLAVFLTTVIAAVLWMLALWVKSKSEERNLLKEKERKAAALKAKAAT